MDTYPEEQMMLSLNRQLEDLVYRIYTIEDSMAQVNAYIEEMKEVV